MTQLPACLGTLPGRAGGGAGPRGAESAAPAWLRPRPGRDTGESGGAVRWLGIFWKMAPAGAGTGGAAGAVGVGMRGRAFPEDRPFPNNTKKGEGRGPPA